LDLAELYSHSHCYASSLEPRNLILIQHINKLRILLLA